MSAIHLGLSFPAFVTATLSKNNNEMLALASPPPQGSPAGLNVILRCKRRGLDPAPNTHNKRSSRLGPSAALAHYTCHRRLLADNLVGERRARCLLGPLPGLRGEEGTRQPRRSGAQPARARARERGSAGREGERGREGLVRSDHEPLGGKARSCRAVVHRALLDLVDASRDLAAEGDPEPEGRLRRGAAQMAAARAATGKRVTARPRR